MKEYEEEELLAFQEFNELSQTESCPFCAGSGAFLGWLGAREWYTCNRCGMEFSTTSKQKE